MRQSIFGLTVVAGVAFALTGSAQVALALPAPVHLGLALLGATEFCGTGGVAATTGQMCTSGCHGLASPQEAENVQTNESVLFNVGMNPLEMYNYFDYINQSYWDTSLMKGEAAVVRAQQGYMPPPGYNTPYTLNNPATAVGTVINNWINDGWPAGDGDLGIGSISPLNGYCCTGGWWPLTGKCGEYQ